MPPMVRRSSHQLAWQVTSPITLVCHDFSCIEKENAFQEDAMSCHSGLLPGDSKPLVSIWPDLAGHLHLNRRGCVAGRGSSGNLLNRGQPCGGGRAWMMNNARSILSACVIGMALLVLAPFRASANTILTLDVSGTFSPASPAVAFAPGVQSQ